jgi:hypothetical protein
MPARHRLDLINMLPYGQRQAWSWASYFLVFVLLSIILVDAIPSFLLSCCKVEYREDTPGEVLRVVTAWHATAQEKRAYEQAV